MKTMPMLETIGKKEKIGFKYSYSYSYVWWHLNKIIVTITHLLSRWVLNNDKNKYSKQVSVARRNFFSHDIFC